MELDYIYITNINPENIIQIAQKRTAPFLLIVELETWKTFFFALSISSVAQQNTMWTQ